MSNDKQCLPLNDTRGTAIKLLRLALANDPGSLLVGGITSGNIAALAALAVSFQNLPCPACGAEPWVNIDCDVCLICSALEGGEVP